MGVPLRCWSDTQRCRARPGAAPTRHVWGTRQSRRLRTADGFAANPRMKTRRAATKPTICLKKTRFRPTHV